MSAMKWSFRPGKIPLLVTLVLVPALASLGFWQLDRARQKQALFDHYTQREAMQAVRLNDAIHHHAEDLLWRRVEASGTYDADMLVFLDNQIMDGKTGYHVLSPFRLEGTGAHILVNRGWLQAGAYRDQLPTVDTPVTALVLVGKIKEPGFTGFLLSEDVIEPVGPGILRTQAVDLQRLEAMLGMEFLPYLLRLEPESLSGFERDWPQTGTGAERHHGYAFQWFTMAAAVVILFIFYTAKKTRVEQD